MLWVNIKLFLDFSSEHHVKENKVLSKHFVRYFLWDIPVRGHSASFASVNSYDGRRMWHIVHPLGLRHMWTSLLNHIPSPFHTSSSTCEGQGGYDHYYLRKEVFLFKINSSIYLHVILVKQCLTSTLDIQYLAILHMGIGGQQGRRLGPILFFMMLLLFCVEHQWTVSLNVWSVVLWSI